MKAKWSGAGVAGLAILFVSSVVVSVLSMSSETAVGVSAITTADAPLRKIAEFELPGPPGKRFDYLTIDETITISWPPTLVPDCSTSST